MTPFNDQEISKLRKCGWLILDGFTIRHPAYPYTILERQKNGQIKPVRFYILNHPQYTMVYKSLTEYLSTIS